jgi:gamma-glutamyl:cysteine ligase YbdK (ATP-grasp superfamily)
MGAAIGTTDFDEADRARFRRRLHENLAALGVLLARPGFGQGPVTLGAEVELYLTGRDARARGCNIALLEALADPQFCPELDRFNIEYNLRPVAAAGTPFARMERELVDALTRANAAAAAFGARVVPVGILPTLRERDVGPQSMTPLPRYAALDRALRRNRGERFAIRIGGAEPLVLERSDVTLEGACTSFQVHLRVPPADFARRFNAVQLTTPLVLAAGCNSPLLLGRRLWQETRVPLFKLAVDGRDRDSRELHLPPRVDLGTGWVREGALELFAAAVHLHEPLLPLATRENALSRVRRGATPKLAELRLHLGTLWPWNRPVYDPAGGGHLRIELRALPAGPSPVDMLANAAFAIGLACGLDERVDALLPALPFALVVQNFYRAAQHGLAARLFWPGSDGTLQRRDAAELALEQLPFAARGLHRLGVSRPEVARCTGILRRRIEQRTGGAAWQLRQLARLEPRLGRARALQALVRLYTDCALANQPVHEWPDAS